MARILDRNAPKEAEVIKLERLPDAAKFRAWKQSLRLEVQAASGNPRAYQWISQVESSTAALASLAFSDGFDTLDTKLASACFRAAAGREDVLGRLTREAEIAHRSGRFLKGRQCLFLIYDFYRIYERSCGLFDFNDLVSVKWLGDAALERFMGNRDNVLCNLRVDLPDQIKESLFVRHVRQSRLLANDMAH
jgi:hypothetical protein